MMTDRLSCQMMMEITHNFSKDNLLVKGNKWEVYKGTYLEKQVTVKVWRFLQGQEEIGHFQDEMSFLDSQTSCAQNLLTIIGLCFHPPGLVGFVYDVASLATLHSKLSDESFNWSLRLRAILDIARTIAYLHDRDPCFTLRNLEPAYILLDRNFKPFLCDLGFGHQHILKTAEFKRLHIGHSGTSLTADDVFDFGCVVLALLAMRPVLDEKGHVVEWVNSLSKDMRERRICCAYLMSSDYFTFSDAADVGTVALECVRRSAKRPSMKKVVASLEDVTYIKFFIWRDRGMRHSSCCAAADQGTLSSKTVADIQVLTGGWSADNLLCKLDYILEGSRFISLYRGEMKQDSQSGANKEVTVKFCYEPGFCNSHFENEMLFLTHNCMTSHPNVAKLIGFCKDEKMRAAIYDVASQSSLEGKLADTEYDWAHRIKAALGIANAVAFLHSQKPPCVLNNINPINIVLDKDGNPTLIDFGLVTGCKSAKKKFYRRHYFGLRGYLDTECDEGTEADVYSFGVLLLALISGRVAFDLTNPVVRVVDYAASKSIEIVPLHLKQCTGYCDNDCQTMLNLACSCVSKYPKRSVTALDFHHL